MCKESASPLNIRLKNRGIVAFVMVYRPIQEGHVTGHVVQKFGSCTRAYLIIFITFEESFSKLMFAAYRLQKCIDI